MKTDKLTDKLKIIAIMVIVPVVLWPIAYIFIKKKEKEDREIEDVQSGKKG